MKKLALSSIIGGIIIIIITFFPIAILKTVKIITAITYIALFIGVLIYAYKIKFNFIKTEIFLSVFEVKIIWRYLTSIILSLIVSVLLWSIDVVLLSNILIKNWTIFVAVTGVFFIYFALADKQDTIVPSGHAGVLKFWGFRFPIFFTEGTYPWTGKNIGVTFADDVRTEGTLAGGFINVKTFPLAIWNQSDQKGRLKLECYGSDTSEVRVTLTLPVQIINPLKWIDSIDPVKDLADGARESLRNIVSYFTAPDNTLLKDVYWEMMSGKKIVTAFLPQNGQNYVKGEIIKTVGGKPLYQVVDERGVDIAKQEFEDKIMQEAREDMLIACTNSNGKIKIEERSVVKNFQAIWHRVGVTIESATIGNIDLADEVVKKANEAASESYQRLSQVASAETYAKTAKIYKEAGVGMSDFEKGIAAAQDNDNVKIFVTGGSGSDLLKAAAVHADTAKGDKK